MPKRKIDGMKLINERDIPPKRKTMFGKAKHPWLAKIICIESPACATEAVNKLESKVNNKNVRLIKKAVVEAANRAEASMKRKNISQKEYFEMRDVTEVYRTYALVLHSKKYPMKKL